MRRTRETVIRIGDGLSRTVEQLSREAASLQAEVFRFRLPEPRRGGTLQVGIHQSAMFESTRGLDPLFTLDNQMVEIGASIYAGPPAPGGRGDGPRAGRALGGGALGARSYRFFLRAAASPSTTARRSRAEDVKRHFERLLDPEVDSPDQWIFKEVEGAKDYLAGRGQDGLRLRGARRAHAGDPPRGAQGLLPPPGHPAGHAGDPDAGPTGGSSAPGRTGRCSLERARVVLERHPTYFRSTARSWTGWSSTSTRTAPSALERLQAGELDVVSGLYAEHVQAAGGRPAAGHRRQPALLLVHGLPRAHAALRRRAGAGRASAPGSTWRRWWSASIPGARVASTLTPPSLLTGELPPPPRTNVALARQLLRDAGRGPAAAEPRLSAGPEHRGRGRAALPPADGGRAWWSWSTPRSSPPTSGSARARAAARVPRGVDRRLPGRRTTSSTSCSTPARRPSTGWATGARSWTGSPPRRG